MAVFTQFSSDLDEVTKKQLTHGNVLMELLKQPLEHPLAMHEQVIILVAVTSGRIDHIPVRFVREYKEKLISHFNYNCQEICAEITRSGDLTEALRKSILDEIDEFNKTIEDY
jgi:F-type H+-transporting ATPase subunit alpha